MAGQRPCSRKLTALLLASSIAASCSSNGEISLSKNDLVKVSGKVSGKVVNSRAPANVFAIDIGGVDPISLPVEVSTDGVVAGDVTVRMPLTKAVGESDVVFGLTAQSPGGPVEILPAEVDDDAVSVTTTHFSLFGSFRMLIGEVLKIARQVLQSVTGQVTAEATAPKCAEEAAARTSGYSITSDRSDAVLWCFGTDGARRTLTLVNNRRYALLTSFGAGAKVSAKSTAGFDLAKLLQPAIAKDEVVVAPRESVTFSIDLASGQDVNFATEYDGVGNSIAQLQFGVDAALTLMGKFGAGPKTGSTEARQKVLALVGKRPCLDAIVRAKERPGDLVGACFGFDELKEVFGVGAATLLTPTFFVGGALSFFRSEFNALGDLVSSRDKYRIKVKRATKPVEPPDSAIRSVDFASATLPAGSCNFGDWSSDQPIRLIEGAGNSDQFDPDSDYLGVSVTASQVVGYADIDSDGAEDAVVAIDCSGSAVEMCCAGRSSLLTFAIAVRLDGNALQLVGRPITGEPIDGADTQITNVALDGKAIVTTESVIYPETDGAFPDAARRYLWNGSAFSSQR